MKNVELLRTLIAVPAIAGLMYVAGCDNTDDAGTPDGTTGTVDDTTTGAGADAGSDPLYNGAETASGTLDQARQGAQGMSDSVKQQIEQPLSNLEESLNSAEETASAEDSSVITRAKEAVDGIRQSVEDGNMTDINRYVTQLQSMKAQLPANVQQQIDQVVSAIPGASSLQGLGTGTGAGSGTGQTGGTTPPPTTPDNNNPPAGNN